MEGRIRNDKFRKSKSKGDEWLLMIDNPDIKYKNKEKE